MKPETSREVAKILSIISDALIGSGSDILQFAVRSGGHAPDAGSANIHGGITIDLSLLNQVEMSTNGNLVSYGPAARWGHIYEHLESAVLAVAGGRVASVGAAGLALGGGLSFFSPRRGFVCDDIEEYEIALANGDLVHATRTSHPDLWRALKGGGNNFGVVTKFTARTFLQDKVWAGYNYHPASAAPSLFETFYNFSLPENFDEYATAWLAIGYSSKWRSTAVVTHLVHTKSQKNPPALQPLMKVRRFWSTVKVESTSDTGREMDINSPPGFRALFKTTTFENDLGAFSQGMQKFKDCVGRVKSVKGLTLSLMFQTLHPTTTAKGGDNMLGIETKASLVVALVSVSWKLEEDDKIVHATARDLIAALESYAVERGIDNRYKYLNYAGRDQDPIPGYGQENKTKLQEISLKYDPHGLFQKCCVGGFKLSGSPLSNP